MDITQIQKKIKLYPLLWLFFIVVVLICDYSDYSDPNHKTVIHDYLNASANWVAGKNIYDLGHARGFLYFPSTAVIGIPFTWIPPLASEILIRCLSCLVFASAVYRFSRVTTLGRKTPLYFLTGICFIIGWSTFRSGQLTAIMTALMIHSTVDLLSERYSRAALWLCVAIAIKPLAIVYALLVTILHRRMPWRMALGVIGIFLLPFLAQSPIYVEECYSAFVEKLSLVIEVSAGETGYRHIFRIAEGVGITFNSTAILGTRLLAAAGTLALAVAARYRWEKVQAETACISLAVMYVLLFNTRTEGNTYIMILPVALFPFWRLSERKEFWEGVYMLAILVVIFSSYELTGGRDYILKPTMCALLYVQVAWLIVRGKALFGVAVQEISEMEMRHAE